MQPNPILVPSPSDPALLTWSRFWREARSILVAVLGRALAELAWRSMRAVASRML